MLKRGFYAALVFCVFTLAACSYKEQVALGGVYAPPLYALSKEAGSGTLSLSGGKSLEYVFESPFKPEEEYSLEIDYSLRFPPGAGEEVLEDPVLVTLGNDSWELPNGFSFLGELAPQNESGTFSACYAVPLGGDSIERISFGFDTQSKKKKNEAPVLEIKGMAFVKRWYGFSSGDETRPPALTPFVYARDSSLVINPPAVLRGEGGMEMRIRALSKAVSLKAADFSVECSSRFLNVPPVFISSESFPLSASAEAQLVPVKARPFPEPIPADPGVILDWPAEAWRDSRYEVFRWESFPSILVLDMADYDTQDRFLKRLAFYVEKAGYRGRLVPYSEVADIHGWNAHDYSAQSLARFFEAVRKADFQLLDEEAELRELLLSTGVLLRGRNGEIIPGEGALVSISRESPDYLRATFMVHEGYHGLYFIDGDFRDFCAERWDAFKDPGRRFLLSFFEYQLYDTKDRNLVVNEFMAYLLQQGVSRAGKYFGETRPNEMLKISPWRRASMPQREEVLPSGNLFFPELAEAFAAEAAVFSDYVERRWGLEAGRVRSVWVSF